MTIGLVGDVRSDTKLADLMATSYQPNRNASAEVIDPVGLQ